MRTLAEVTDVLKRALNSGPIRRLPRKQADAEVLLALSVVHLSADAFYAEAEINLHLSQWLAVIAASDGAADYITLRRRLVDLGFLRRADDGAIYRLVPERIDRVLAAQARTIDPDQVFIELEKERGERKANVDHSASAGLDL